MNDEADSVFAKEDSLVEVPYVESFMFSKEGSLVEVLYVEHSFWEVLMSSP